MVAPDAPAAVGRAPERERTREAHGHGARAQRGKGSEGAAALLAFVLLPCSRFRSGRGRDVVQGRVGV